VHVHISSHFAQVNHHRTNRQKGSLQPISTTQTPQANIATFQADAASAVIKAIKYNKRINKNR
jgi:hypothetical protein